MAFAPSRLDHARLARVPFGTAWLELVDPADAGACDPFDARARLAMYRLLVERGNTRGAFGAHDELSPFWGYASQLAWQHASGRLGDGASWAIDPDSWWGACNYALCVVPYVAGTQLGVVPALACEPPPAPYAPAIAAWRDAIALARDARDDDRDRDRVRVAFWRAHLASIAIAIVRQRRELAALPAAEQRFARGWVRMVELFGAAAIRTDLVRLADGNAALPSRVLDARALDDLSRFERATARRVSALADRPSWRWRIEMRAWRRVVRTRAARGDAESLIAAMLGHGGWPIRLRALAYAALPAFVLDR
jgi:hypothetical protein